MRRTRSMARGVRTPKIRTCARTRTLGNPGNRYWATQRACSTPHLYLPQIDIEYLVTSLATFQAFSLRGQAFSLARQTLSRTCRTSLLCTRHITRNSLSVYYSSLHDENLDHLVSTLQRNRMEISVSIGLRDSRARYTYRSTTGLDFSWNLSNLTNATNSTIDCNPMLGNSSVRDGNIPQVLGISIGAWAVGI